MRLVFALVLLIGLGIAGGAVYMAMERFSAYERALASNKKAPVQKIEMTTVYVAAAPLQYGHVLTKDDVKAVKWPTNVVPENTFTDETELLGTGEDRDVRAVLREMDPGEPIMLTKVTDRGEDPGLAWRLGENKQAYAMKSEIAAGISGLRAGDRVDVYWTFQDGGQSGTKLMLEGLEVIATDETTEGNRAKRNAQQNVVVAATKQNIARLITAERTGTLLLSLRGINDETIGEKVEVSQADLLDRERIVKREQKVCTIKTRKGAEVIEIPIPCPTN